MPAISVCIPPSLIEYSNVRGSIVVYADNLLEVATQLQARYPSLYQAVFDETGRVRRHINFFLNADWIDVHTAAAWDTPFIADDKLTIWTAVSGG